MIGAGTAYAARVARPGAGEPDRVTRRRPTATSNFGVGKRESHDASAFYERFEAPTLSGDDAVVEPYEIAEPFVEGDARHMDAIVDDSVALVVTSPPYFAGKQYEEELEREGVPELVPRVPRSCSPTCSPSARASSNRAAASR